MTETKHRGRVEAPPKPKPEPRRKSAPLAGRVGDGPLCPGDNGHGNLYWMDGSGRYYCPHIDHAGRIATHPQGFTAQSKCFWNPQELGR